jgi:hypothetical protein
MLASVVFIGAVLCAVGFSAWLAFFILNRGFNTMLETRAESWRNSRNSLLLGVVLLALAVGLSYQFFQLEPPLTAPPIDPGMSLNVVPDAPGPSLDKTLVAGAMVLSGVAFLFWLGAFALNRSFNTSLRSGRDANRSAAGQLVFGAMLLGLTGFFAVTFFRIDQPVAGPAVAEERPAAEQPAPAPAPGDGAISSAIQQQVSSIDRAKEVAGVASGHAETADSIGSGGE